MAADVFADISDAASQLEIKIDERDLEAYRQKRTDCALAGSTRAE